MNQAIKILEEIGQNTSLNQHENLIEMLKSLDVKENTFDNINLIKKELVCGLLPEDDGEDENEEEQEDGESEE